MSLLSRIFTSTRKWLSRRMDWMVSDDFMNSSFWHSCVPWNVWRPQSSIEKVNDFVLCIRRQRFTRIVKAPKRISCRLELGNHNFHVPIMCKPMYTTTHHGENRYRCVWRLLFIFSAGFRLSHETSNQRISCLVKIRDSFGFLSKDYCWRFSL